MGLVPGETEPPRHAGPAVPGERRLGRMPDLIDYMLMHQYMGSRDGPEVFNSNNMRAIRNTRGVDVGALNAYLRQRGMLISDGYGPLKGQTFRIAHMNDCP